MKEEKVAFLLEVLKNFSFVKTKLVTKDSTLLEEIEEAAHNVNLAKQGKLKPKPLSELLNEL
ncbi:MAG: hypothetical protein KF763_01370 [Cyclobacteriaceae bacterium]|nr:hypothetical protein [Cyclobacteriaceae bacterium]